jgi:hypothetical protein
MGSLGLLAHCGTSSTGLDVADGASSEAQAADTGPQDTDGESTADATLDTGDDSDSGSKADSGSADASTDSTTQPPGDGGADGGDSSVGAPDVAAPDAGATDATTADGGATDAGGTDASVVDAAPTDAAVVDASDASPDGGTVIACDVDAASPCGDSGVLTCCNGACVNTAADPTNCGSCGNACTSTQFCTGTKCDDLIVANICDNPLATISLDPYTADDTAGAAIGAGLAACTPAVTVTQVNQSDGGIVDPVTGRPITGVGNTFVTGGGGFGQLGDHYLDSQALTRLYVTADGVTEQIVDRKTGTNLVNDVDTDLTIHHDYFYVQLTVEPISGTLCFMGVGMLQYGTEAAGYYVGAVMIPNHASYTDTWYVYEWTDTNNDGVANDGDTFTMMTSGQ